ncbi:MAG TPA: hypothetical protein VJG49_01420 [Candidatus Nanoarchaeia archaeon]|nr:hypothetical protein [Candidatus Nanoarchaeia archaeon]
MKKIAVLVIVLVVLFAVSSLADVDTEFACSLGCETLSQNGDSYYCNPDTQTCFFVEEPAAEAAPAAVAPAPAAQSTDQKITALEEKIASLENDLATLSSDLSLTKGEILTIQSQISTLQSELATLQNTGQDLSSKTNTIATGLAGLQQTLDSLQNTLSERQSSSRIITAIFVILLLGGAGWGAYYYINRNQKMVNPEIVNYIHNSIQQGKKQHQIKQELRKAGWMDSDIEKAYDQTVKQNYRRYKSSQPEARETARAEPRSASRTTARRPAYEMADPKKMIIIAVVSILVIIGGLLVLQASTGQAIFLKKLIGGEENGTSGEITYAVECTPPHLLNPTGDACCLDSDNSGVCDTTELQGPGLQQGGQCNDNRECAYGLYCIANTCNSLSSLYTGQGDCSKLCSYYAIKILTSDGETYDLKPKQGSYTGAGALEWKTLQMPQYCKGEQPIVPINILTKQTGEVINEKVIWLHEGQTSQVLTHPNISKIAFTLTVADVFESCPE